MSASKKKSSKKLIRKVDGNKKSNVLNVGHFGQSGGKAAHESDPVRETMIVLTLDELDYYDRNPRKQDNRQFEEIKESIKVNSGLASVLVVTRRPGSDKFMVAAGGNTRVKALQELYKETGDKTFFEIRANFRPWENETKILVDHLIENELRDDLTFIDQAIAIKALKEDLEKEHGKSLSLRKLSDELKRIGYPKSTSLLSRLFYASDVLDSHIPNTLRGVAPGNTPVGKHQIEKIRKLENTFRAIWEHRVSESKGPFQPAFDVTMKSLDKFGDFSVDNLKHELLLALADGAKLPVHYIELDYKRVLSGLPLSEVAGLPEETEDKGLVEPAQPQEQPQPQQSGPPPASQDPPRRKRDSSQNKDPFVYIDTTGGGSDVIPSRRKKLSAKISLKELRDLTYITAQSLASDARLGDLVRPYEYGLGYLVELPHEPLGYKGDDVDLANAAVMRQTVWWLLLFGSEVPVLMPWKGDHVPDGYHLWQDFEDDSEAIFKQVGGPFPYMNLGHNLQSPLFDMFADDYNELTRLGRKIRTFLEDPHSLYAKWPKPEVDDE